jgi:hypothetical protein
VNIKKLNLVGIILLLLVGLVGCDKEKSQVTDSKKLCLYLNSENIDKTLSIINVFLESLPRNSEQSFSKEEQNLLTFTEWLKSSSCVIDANILCVGCIYTAPPISEISFLFMENNVVKKVVLDIAMTIPLRAGICSISEMNDNND